MPQKSTNNRTTTMSPDARQAMRRRRRRRRRIIRTAVVLSVVLVLALVIALLVLRGVGIAASNKGETTSFLAVKAIEVEGDTRYTKEELIEGSGLYVGQSLLAINKAQSHNALLTAFPYLCRVEVSNSSFDTVHITVEETPVLGAVALKENAYLVVGDNNHALERLEPTQLPGDMLTIEGATLQGEAIGKALMDERSLGVCRTVINAARRCDLEGLSSIDMTEKTNIVLWWKGQVEVVLGNETNISTQVEAFKDLLPTLLKNNGDTVSGRLDMTSYADDNTTNDKAIFTPSDLLIEESPALSAEDKEEDTTTTQTDTPTSGSSENTE